MREIQGPGLITHGERMTWLQDCAIEEEGKPYDGGTMAARRGRRESGAVAYRESEKKILGTASSVDQHYTNYCVGGGEGERQADEAGRNTTNWLVVRAIRCLGREYVLAMLGKIWAGMADYCADQNSGRYRLLKCRAPGFGGGAGGLPLGTACRHSWV